MPLGIDENGLTKFDYKMLSVVASMETFHKGVLDPKTGKFDCPDDVYCIVCEAEKHEANRDYQASFGEYLSVLEHVKPGNPKTGKFDCLAQGAEKCLKCTVENLADKYKEENLKRVQEEGD